GAGGAGGGARILDAFCVPLARDRSHEPRPALAAVDPGFEFIHESRLAQKQVPAPTPLEIGASRQSGSRLQEIGRIEGPGAAFTLIAARPIGAAMGTLADDITV